MDFDSIISILLILLFFIFPTLLKRLSQKKKTEPVQAGKTKNGKAGKLSLFEKLGEQIRQYTENLEQEAQKGKQTQENYWDHLADDGEVQSPGEASFETEDYTEDYMEEPVGEPVAEPSVSKESGRSILKPGKPLPAGDPSFADPCRQPRLSSSQLQQAIIWSEILSKPVALREDKTIG